MKRFSRTPKFRRWQKNRAVKIERQKRKRREYDPNRILHAKFNQANDRNIQKDVVVAPIDFRLTTNTEECLYFFNKVRSSKYISRVKNAWFVEVSLREVKYVDYSTMSILIALRDDLKSKGTFLRGDFPKDENCRKFIGESGLLNKMFDENGKRFPQTEKSELLQFEKGYRKFSRQDNIRISTSVKNVVKHLTGIEGHCKRLRTILLEICGNSIEWGGTTNKQWLLGIKYEDNRVIFTVTDVGYGILNTLNKKFKNKLDDFINAKGDYEILRNAFNRKYGSKSKDVNRNKGLPAVKNGFDEGLIQNLKVLTNNVILHFDEESNSREIKGKKNHFGGTFYRWVVTNESINGKDGSN